MQSSLPRIALIVTLLICGELTAQTPGIEITVRTSPGGKGRVVGYDAEADELLVQLSLPSGRTKTVSASRGHVAPSAWRTVNNLLATENAASETNALDSAVSDASIAAAGKPRRPIEVRTTFGDRGTLLGFDADSNSVRVDFDGRTGRPLPIKQLDADSWRLAKRQLALQLKKRKR